MAVFLSQFLSYKPCDFLWHGDLHARAGHMAAGLVREVPDLRTGSSSLNFFEAVFTRVVTIIAQPPPAESMSPRWHLQLIRSDLNFTLWSAVNRAGISHSPCTPIIRIWCQSL